MVISRRIVAAGLLLAIGTAALAQAAEEAGSTGASEDLKIAAVEALITAPPEKALPIVTRVLEGAASVELKERALFILSQIDLPEARQVLVETAGSGPESLRREAIRMIGIQGDPEALAELSGLYGAGDHETKEAVLQAYLIADDQDAVYRIAAEAQDAEEFEDAVKTLGAMGALEQLRALRSRSDMSESLIRAYAVAGDTQTLGELAQDGSNPERQAQAIRGLAIAGGDDVAPTLVEVYRSTDSPEVRDAVRQGLVIADYDQAVLTLFRESADSAEKRKLLETLVKMDSDAVWDVIDSTLENRQ